MSELSPPNPENLQLLLADAVPIQLWIADSEGALTYVNRRTTEYFARSAEDIVGEGWKNVVHPADLESTAKHWQNALQTGTPYRTEFRLQRASDGLYRWHLGLALPVRGDDGEILRWVGSNTDIDDQKRALEVRDAAVARARIEQEHLRQIVLNAPAAMAIYRGPRFEIALVNPLWEQFTGRRGVVGRTVPDVFPEIEAQGLLAILQQVYDTGELFHADQMHVQLDLDGDGETEDTYWSFTLQRLGEYRHRGYDVLLHAVCHGTQPTAAVTPAAIAAD